MNEASTIEKLGWEAIAKAKFDGKIPMWLIQNATSDKTELMKGLWNLSIYIFKKRKLNVDEKWENQADGSKILIRVDPASGKKRYVLHYDAGRGAKVNLFRVEVEMPTQRVTIKEAISATELDRSLFDLYYEER